MAQHGFKLHQTAQKGSIWLEMTPISSKWLHMAPNGSKLLQMAMADTNGYGNGPTLSQIDIDGPKWSITIHYDPT